MTDPTTSATGRGSISSESFVTLEVAVRSEDYFPIRRSDWTRIRGNMEKTKNPASWIGPIGWASLSIGATALVTLSTWPSAYSQLPKEAQLHYAWVTPALLILGLLLILAAVGCYLLGRTVRSFQTTSVESVLADMDECAKKPEQKPTTEPSGIKVGAWLDPVSAISSSGFLSADVHRSRFYTLDLYGTSDHEPGWDPGPHPGDPPQDDPDDR